LGYHGGCRISLLSGFAGKRELAIGLGMGEFNENLGEKQMASHDTSTHNHDSTGMLKYQIVVVHYLWQMQYGYGLTDAN
jgi:hypothetical protein